MESREGRAKLRASKLERTIPLMQSEKWDERFKAEYRQLNVRIEALTDCIKYHDALNPLEIDLFTQQLIAMTNYRNVLELRANIFNIEL